MSTPERRAPIAYGLKKTYLQKLAPVSYRGKENFFKLLLRPFPFFLSPIVWYGFLVYGMTTVWLVGESLLTPEHVCSGTGLMRRATQSCRSARPSSSAHLPTSSTQPRRALSQLVRSLVPSRLPSSLVRCATTLPPGSRAATAVVSSRASRFICSFAVYSADPCSPSLLLLVNAHSLRCRRLVNREFRLVLIAPMLVLEVFAFMGWALITQNGTLHWMAPVMMYTLINVGQSSVVRLVPSLQLLADLFYLAESAAPPSLRT